MDSNKATNNDQPVPLWTRDELRAYFKGSGLDYRYIDGNTVDLLNGFIHIEMQLANVCNEHPYWDKPRKPKVGGDFAELTASGSYFNSRETVSFNQDGYIGFCGDASDSNLQPIARAFVQWCDFVAANAVHITTNAELRRELMERYER